MYFVSITGEQYIGDKVEWFVKASHYALFHPHYRRFVAVVV